MVLVPWEGFEWRLQLPYLVLMAESLASITWQETVDLAVARLEEKTGLSLAGLSQTEISVQVREWINAKAEGRLQSESGSQVS